MASVPTRLLLLLLAAAPLAAPGRARALTPNHSVALQALAPLVAPRASPGLSLAAGTWLEGDFDVVVRLTWWSARRTQVRGTASALEPAVGLRWAPGRSGGRPVASLEAGVRLPRPAAAAALAARLRAGVEWLPGRELGLAAGLGLRWTAGAGAAAEATLEGALYF
jgi:hypothetical protein